MLVEGVAQLRENNAQLRFFGDQGVGAKPLNPIVQAMSPHIFLECYSRTLGFHRVYLVGVGRRM
jgi:hypothetical protein